MEINFEKLNIIFIDGLTLETVRIKYNWLLNANVKDAIIGEDDNGLVWYSGDWLCGVWEDGTWYSGNFHDGIWKKGDFYSYKLNKFDLVSNKFIIRDRSNKYSRFLNGVWLDGNFHNGYFGNYDIEDWEDFEITNEKEYLTFKRSTEDVGGEPVYEFKNLATWVNGIFENGVFEHSIWLNGRFLNGLMLNSKWINGRWYNGTFNGESWYNGEWFNGEFIRGKWYNGTFNKIKDDLVSRFGNTIETTDSVSKHICQWFDGVWKNGEFFSGYIEENGEIKESKDHWLSIWYKGTWENGIWYGGHFKGGEWFNGDWKAGVFGDFSIGDWCDPLYVYQDDIINSGITTWENVGIGDEPDITNDSSSVESFYNNQGEYEFKNYNYTINIDEISKPIKHGYLYNHFAVSGIGNNSIANFGWRLPTIEDYGIDVDDITLGHFLSTELLPSNGGKTKSTNPDYWNEPNNGAENLYNMDFRGSGIRERDGNYKLLKSQINLWTQTNKFISLVSANDGASSFTMSNTFIILKKSGYSVRLCRNATTEEEELGDGTYCDPYIGNDGKIYKTVKIGNKVWLAENLAETKLRNGAEIPNITDDDEWKEYGDDEKGARCAYNNNEDNAFITDTNIFRVNNNVRDITKVSSAMVVTPHSRIDYNYDLIDIINNQTCTIFINGEENVISGINHMGEIESDISDIENIKFIVKRPIELLPGDGSEMTYWGYDSISISTWDHFSEPMKIQKLIGKVEPFFTRGFVYLEQGDENDIVRIIETGQTINVGDSFRGGKIIHMEDDPDDPDNWRGIIAANNIFFNLRWGCMGELIGTSQYLFHGKENTEKIIDSCNEPNIAAKICVDYSVIDNGITYNEWWLPSIDELQLIDIPTRRTTSRTWSSTEYSDDPNMVYIWDGTTITKYNKNLRWRVVPISYFSVPKEYYVVIDKTFTNEDANKSGILARYNTLMNERLSNNFITSSTNPNNDYNIQSRNKLLFQDFNVVYGYVDDAENTTISGIQIEIDVKIINDNNRVDKGFKTNKIFIPLKNLDYETSGIDQAYYGDVYRNNPGLPNILEGKDITLQIGDKNYILGGVGDMWGVPGLEQYYSNDDYNIELLETIRDNFRLGVSFGFDSLIDQRIIVKKPRLRVYYSNISERPKWYNGTWHKGTWFDGEFHGGAFISGLWLNGRFINGNLSSDYR